MIVIRQWFVFCLLLLALQSCASSPRFMRFGWQSKEEEVLDSLKAWGFTYNEAKGRWEGGTLDGYECQKLKVWFDDEKTLEGVEAKYLDLAYETSGALFARLHEQTESYHGPPDRVENSNGDVVQDRRIWFLSDDMTGPRETIMIVHFNDYVLYHVARDMPEPFSLVPTSGAAPLLDD